MSLNFTWFYLVKKFFFRNTLHYSKEREGGISSRFLSNVILLVGREARKEKKLGLSCAKLRKAVS